MSIHLPDFPSRLPPRRPADDATDVVVVLRRQKCRNRNFGLRRFFLLAAAGLMPPLRSVDSKVNRLLPDLLMYLGDLEPVSRFDDTDVGDLRLYFVVSLRQSLNVLDSDLSSPLSAVLADDDLLDDLSLTAPQLKM